MWEKAPGSCEDQLNVGPQEWRGILRTFVYYNTVLFLSAFSKNYFLSPSTSRGEGGSGVYPEKRFALYPVNTMNFVK